MPCETESDLGTRPRATCNDFQEPQHTQALLEAAGADDPYGLDPDGYMIACNGDEVTTGGGGGTEVGVQVTTGSSSVYPYTAYMLAGGVPIGAHTFGLVTQGQAATDDGVQAATTQTADDGSGKERRHDCQKTDDAKKK